MRISGRFAPLYLSRFYGDDGGDPLGYELMNGIGLLNPDDREVFGRLRDRFRFKDVNGLMEGNSGSNVKRFLDRCTAVGLIRKDGKDYFKIQPASVERVEQMEYPPIAPPTPSTPSVNDQGLHKVFSGQELTEAIRKTTHHEQ